METGNGCPAAGQARGIQVDLKPDRIGLRYPVEVGLTGDVKATLSALLPLLTPKSDRSFLLEAQRRMSEMERAPRPGRDHEKGRRIVQQQKGLIVRLRAARVHTWEAERTLRLFEANLRRFEEHRDVLKGER